MARQKIEIESRRRIGVAYCIRGAGAFLWSPSSVPTA